MKYARRTVSFVSGMLTTLLLVSMITPALAAGLSKYIEVSTGVSVYVDDVKLDPRDANGNPVEVFIYNGTTYLPVRAVSEALEVPVQWDGNTRSVYVGKHTGDKPAVWLTNLDYFSGTDSKYFPAIDAEQDNTGTTHYHCINNNFNRTYNIDGKYSKMSGILYQSYAGRSNSAVSMGDRIEFLVYGDGELLYSKSFESKETGIDPIEFDIDLTGVLKMQVIFHGYSQGFGPFLSLGDVGLWT